MLIDNNTSVGTPVQGVERLPKVDEIKHGNEEVNEQQQTAENEATEDYQVSLSDEAKTAVAELNKPAATDQSAPAINLTEEEAFQLSSQTAQQLSQTNTAIANLAIQKAVDLFA